MGYHRAGFEVVGVDIKPQPNYPFEFHQADALEFLPDGFDAIHASPPCQAYSTAAAQARKRGVAYAALLPRTRALVQLSGLPYVIENVAGAPLINAITICGSSFGLMVRRHRLFECSFPVMAMPCAHHLQTEPRYWTGWRPGGKRRLSTVAQVYGNGGHAHEWAEAMGIDWMTHHELREAIPPAYTEHIGEYLMAAVRRRVAA